MQTPTILFAEFFRRIETLIAEFFRRIGALIPEFISKNIPIKIVLNSSLLTKKREKLGFTVVVG